MTIDAVAAYSGTVPNKDLQTSSVFSLNADGFMPWIATTFPIALSAFATQANAVGAQCDAAAAIATAGATTALTARDQAQASALTAQTYAPMWVSGTYTMGNAAWSQLNFHTYRCKVTGSRTIDPANDPTNWEDITPGPSASIMAKGSLGAGSAVVLTADGKVAVLGAPYTQYIASNGYSCDAAYDATNSKVIVVSSNGGGFAVVGTISGPDITFGNPVALPAAAQCSHIAYGGGKVVITYTTGSGYGTAIVGTVSGDTISFGTAVVFKSAAVTGGCPKIAYIGYNKFVIVYTSSNTTYAICGTVSGSAIAFAAEYNLGAYYYSDICFDVLNSNSTTAIAIVPMLNPSYYLYAMSISINISTGVIAQYTAGQQVTGYAVAGLACAYDSSRSCFVIAYNVMTGSTYNRTTAIVGKIVTGTMTLGGAVSISDANVDISAGYYQLSLSFDSVNNVMALIINPSATAVIWYSVITPDIALTLTFTIQQSLKHKTIGHYRLVFCAAAHLLLFTELSTIKGKALVLQPISGGLVLTCKSVEQFIGFVENAYADGTIARVKLVGNVISGLSGLIAGSKYYFNYYEGTFTIDNTPPNYYAGIAKSSSELIIGA